MKKMKIAVLALFAAAMGASVQSWAFQSVARSTFTAGTKTSGALIANVTVKVRDNTAPFGADRSSVTWSGVTIPGTGFKAADRFLLLNATVTDVGGGVQIYTRNTETDASPKFQDPTAGDKTNSDSMAAGLVAGLPGTTSTVTPLPIAWSIKASSQVIGTDLAAADPNNGPTTGIGNKFQWLYMKDRYNTANIVPLNFTAFVDGQAFITMINVTGLHIGQADTDFTAFLDGLNSFAYLEADFTTAAAQATYQTSTLTVESYLQ